MRKFKIIIETGIAGGDFEDVFEVDDDATPDEIHDEAKEIFFNYCNYSYHEIKDEEEEQKWLILVQLNTTSVLKNGMNC
ncbi:hypothetical protein HC347_01950 [Escherichia coli]|uniref:DUF7167 family protein n=4 Tax=Escherichia coli TaxID=562 RepID=UPI001C45C7DA|nr:hypothetical protein [Escherichia coli]MBW0063798.1 hypothetical protein [Escherichia coli]